MPVVEQAADELVLEARNFGKTFAGRTVLRDFNLDLRAGETHALLGQNGSGKSTFIKMLNAFYEPDDGATLKVRGEEVALPMHPGQPQAHGVVFVHQDLGLAPDLTVLENLRVGQYQTKAAWRIPWAVEKEEARARLARFGVEVDPEALVSSLSEADRAMLAIVRATDQLAHVDRGLLVLDEPTVYLTRDAVAKLFQTVRRVTESGHSVLIVTHRLDEVFELAQRVTVIRDGDHVITTDVASVDEEGLVSHILGRRMDRLYPEKTDHRGSEVLSAKRLSGRRVNDVSLTLRRGEVLGVTGLIGMGSEELPYLLVGAGKATSGDVVVKGRSHSAKSLSPSVARRHGIALLPADRPKLGGVGAATVAENLTLATLKRYFKGGALRHAAERRRSAELLEHFDVRPRNPSVDFGTLSGGNQQKVLLAKWFEMEPDVFIMHEPTQGVDIGARQQIFAQIEAAAAAGTAVIIASVEYEDLAHLCHRVLVLREGEVVAELAQGELSADDIVERCYIGSTSGDRQVTS